MYDVHTHFVPPEVVDWLKENQKLVNAKWLKRDPAKADFLSVNDTWEFELKETFVNPELYLQEQERAGVNHSLVSPIPQLFLYDFPAEITAELATVYNRGLANWIGRHDTKLSALATLPLNQPERAAEEQANAMKQGLKGAIIASSWSGNRLSDDSFIPFWEAANELGAIVFIHPLLCTDPRLRQKKMPNLIGVPWETTVSATDILLNGLLDKYPKAKILLAHGGGFLPYQMGRLQKGHAMWKDVSNHLEASPQEYLQRFWYDTILWNPAGVQYLVDIAGEDQVVPGTDFPFDLCEWPPGFTGSAGFHKLVGIK